ncbi:RHS repeat domain-containing protein [Robiginitalea aurantiaca]|uniref:RHS repeat-associated core domain-containing protein n=1 Tax=Robiginitalea aurantiaca TaxID=3056915 RepID=A0ABT7WID2_9FLAO|nr:RHS repeat-associated core domain-containing protein [Robiginitalea aurantiaca]MDM9632684.1 RHS repeat-associated core domain-containing protein [Robiginitalea aurantiaca]
MLSNAQDYGTMDNLTFNYQNNSNKLMKVSDELTNDMYGFKDDAINFMTDGADDYSYDQNGNMISDANKGITSITYNHLNLPTLVSFGSDDIEYIYDAMGTKLKKIVTQNSVETRTAYAGNYIYENGALQFFSHPEGYVTPDGMGGYDYVYNYKDQVNNVRLSYSDLDGNGAIDPNTEILHERNYYPFGLLHRGYNNVINGTVNNKEQYQGQEWTEDLGLNVHEWKFRFSDPAIGRFWSIDPLAEQYSYQSPYNFSENRVIDAFELEGLEKVSIHTRAFAPFKTFGGGFSGDGASRGFTTSQSVTSRVKQAVNIDFDQSRPIVSGGTQTSDPTHHPLLGTDTAPDRNALKNVQIGETSTGAKQVSFQSEIEGANPLTPKALTPNIDVDGAFSISSNQETGVLSISANITGDNFPSTESFITDSAGNSVFIGVGALQGNPATSLPGEGGKGIINTDFRINFNSDGVFQNINYNGQQYSIQDYNKLFETQNPNGN